MKSPIPRTARYSRKQAVAALCMLAALLPSCANNKDKLASGSSAEVSATGPVKPAPQSTPPPGISSVTPTLRPAGSGSTDGIWFNNVAVSGPYIALTFDDGPSPANTPRLLNILQEQGVKATFYVVGRNVSAYPAIARRIVNEGHEIANHTWNHPKLTGIPLASVESQLQRTHDIIVTTTGVRPRTFRPPYGAFNRSLAVWANDKFGYKTIMWDVDPLDWKYRNAAAVQSKILSGTRSGSIVLAHDIHKTSVDAMPGTISRLKAAGYRFVTVSQLIALGNKGPLSYYQRDTMESKVGQLVKLAPARSTVPAAPYLMPRLARQMPAAPRAPIQTGVPLIVESPSQGAVASPGNSPDAASNYVISAP